MTAGPDVVRDGGPRHDALPDDADKRAVVESMFDRIAPRYDLLNRLLTFRMDVGWRRAAVTALGLGPGDRVLDVACGTGDFCRELETAGLRPIGIDFSAGMLAAARTNAPLVRTDALVLPFHDSTFEGLTCGFALRNLTSLPDFLTECARVLRPGGRFAFVEVSEPAGASARFVHQLWFRKVVPFVGGLLSDRRAYAYLPASTAYLPGPAELLLTITASGFEDVARETLGFGAAQLLTGTRA